MTKITDWANCYDLGWKGLITDEAFSHPAKYSRALIFKIIEYALQGGLIQPGGIILDPFGGVGLGALPSLMNGLNWVGCELEARFVELGRKNIDLWNGKFSGMPKWTGTAQLLAGDSRRLAEVIAGAGLVVSSPPFIDQGANDKRAWGGMKEQPAKMGNYLGGLTDYGSTAGQLAALKEGDITAVISSPPFAGNTGGRGEASRNGIDAALFDRHSGGMKKGTGSDPANLDHLPMGTVGAVIASPPYAESLHNQVPGIRDARREKNRGDIQQAAYGSSSGQLGAMVVGSPPYASGEKGHPSLGSVNKDDWGNDGRDIAGRRGVNGSYGQAEGQLGAMVVGSPPFEKSGTDRNDKNGVRVGFNRQVVRKGRPDNIAPGETAMTIEYGSTPGQIGTESGETFWTAAKLIVTQCYEILPDGAAAIWVTKRYVKNGKVVDFPGQWQALCEACGFETVEIIRAWLVKRNGAQGTIEGGTVSKDVARKSFFRRLSEANTKAAKHWQTLSRDDQARLLWSNHGDLWRDYFVRLALFNLPDEDKEKAGVKLDMTAPPVPNYKRVLKSAQSEAYARDGKPDYEIETSIDFETVLVTRKRGA